MASTNLFPVASMFWECTIQIGIPLESTDDFDVDEMDETIHVYSRHFDAMEECKDFISSWGDTIRSRGIDKVQDLLKDGYKIKLEDLSCAVPGSLWKDKPNDDDDEENNVEDVR